MGYRREHSQTPLHTPIWLADIFNQKSDHYLIQALNIVNHEIMQKTIKTPCLKKSSADKKKRMDLQDIIDIFYLFISQIAFQSYQDLNK